jgi:diguanylate cyclase (GGDEF)-like protein
MAESRPAPETLDEVRALVPAVQGALRDLSDELAQARRDLAAARARLEEAERLADRDPLTGLLNRRGFARELRRAAALASRHAQPSAVIYLDLDGFKRVNDVWGHDAGDAALVHVARLLEANLRETDAVARLGGDEFAALLALADAEAAQGKAAALERLIAATPLRHAGREIAIGASFGVRALTAGLAPEHALAEADRAMFAAKRARKLRAVG